MAKTPEGKVKDAVKKALMENGVVLFGSAEQMRPGAEYDGVFYMPVAGPFSVHGVHDFVGCWHGVFFSLETKAPNESSDATPHQERFRAAVDKVGGLSYVGVRDASVVADLRRRVLERVGLLSGKEQHV